MNQKIFNNIVLITIVIILIKYITPDNESTTFILNKYYNFIIDKLLQFLNTIGLYKYIENFSFVRKTRIHDTNNIYIRYFIKAFNKINPKVSPLEINNLYIFIESLMTNDIDTFFLTPSYETPYQFTTEEINKIKSILLNKLNLGSYSFSNIEFLKNPVYYHNFSGKEIEPFAFNVTCSNNFDELQIYIKISIRNDVKQNMEYLTIDKIKLIIDLKDPKLNNLYNKEHLYDNQNLMDDIHIDYDEQIFENTNTEDDFIKSSHAFDIDYDLDNIHNI